MRFFFISITAIISLSLASKAEATADGEDAIETESSGKRTCRIIFPERPNDAPKIAYLFDGNENHRVDLPSMNFSKVVELPTGELTVVLSPSEITGTEVLPAKLPRLEIDSNIRDFYILLSTDPKNPSLPIQMKLINANDNKLKLGTALWINQTDHRIVAKLGENEISIDPDGQTITQAPISDSGYYRAAFHFQPHGEGELHKITEQHWWHDANSRHLGFIVDSGGRLPKIYFYRDFR